MIMLANLSNIVTLLVSLELSPVNSQTDFPPELTGFRRMCSKLIFLNTHLAISMFLQAILRGVSTTFANMYDFYFSLVNIRC